MYQPLLDCLVARINSWSNKFLSTARRLQFIRSVLKSLTCHWLTVVPLLIQLYKDIGKLFLLTRKGVKGQSCSVKWNTTSVVPEEGGSEKLKRSTRHSYQKFTLGYFNKILITTEIEIFGL